MITINLMLLLKIISLIFLGILFICFIVASFKEDNISVAIIIIAVVLLTPPISYIWVN